MRSRPRKFRQKIIHTKFFYTENIQKYDPTLAMDFWHPTLLKEYHIIYLFTPVGDFSDKI